MAKTNIPVMEKRYQEEVVPSLVEEFGYANVMQAPKVTKLVVNIGMGEANDNPKTMDFAVDTLRTITGQQPIITRAKKSVAGSRYVKVVRLAAK